MKPNSHILSHQQDLQACRCICCKQTLQMGHRTGAFTTRRAGFTWPCASRFERDGCTSSMHHLTSASSNATIERGYSKAVKQSWDRRELRRGYVDILSNARQAYKKEERDKIYEAGPLEEQFSRPETLFSSSLTRTDKQVTASHQAG